MCLVRVFDFKKKIDTFDQKKHFFIQKTFF